MLRRVDIDIDSLRIHREIHEVVGLHVGGEQLLVAGHDRLVEIRMAHVSAVHKEILQGISAPCMLRQSDESRYLHDRCLCLDQQLLVERFAEQLDYALFQRAAHQFVERGVVADNRKLHSRVHECQTFELPHDIGELHRIFFQKLTPCGHVEKQALHHQVTARSACLRLLALHARSVYDQTRAYARPMQHCAQVYACHGSYRGKSLAAEPHGVKCEQIGSL